MALTKKQKDVFDFISSYIEDFGYSPTQLEIKNQFNFKSLGSVQSYIKYLVNAGLVMNGKNTARGLMISCNASHLTSKQDQLEDKSDGIEIPLIGSVAAGNPIEAIELCSESFLIDPSLIEGGGEFFALKVQGDSMIEDGILEGDKVICRSQKNALNGQKVVAWINGEATLKKLYKMENSVELHPANKNYSPIIIQNTNLQFKIIGVVVGLFRKY